MGKIVIALVGALALVGCGADDEPAAEPEPPGEEQSAEDQLEELEGRGIDVELSREDVRAARAAIREIEAQAEGAARIPREVADMDLLPSEEGARFLFAEGFIDRGAFCDAVDAVVDADAYGRLDGEVIELDEAVAEGRFAAAFDAAAHEGISDMGATMYNALFVECLDV